MTERPILLSAPMVRAAREDKKTQTRRIVKFQGEPPVRLGTSDDWNGNRADDRMARFEDWGPRRGYQVFVGEPWDDGRPRVWAQACPYGQPGDLLWVKETFAPCILKEDPTGTGERWSKSVKIGKENHFAYRADGEDDVGCIRWSPSIFMPRRASRLTLRITDVRVERVQSISLADARAEGIPQMHQEAVAAGLCEPTAHLSHGGPTCRDIWDNRTSAENFAMLWDSINGKRPGCSWADNPWVWVLVFERIKEAPRG